MVPRRSVRAGVRAVAWAAAVVVGVGAGCSSDPRSGYAFSGGFERTISSVAVPVWDNVTFHHGLESQLTDAIVQEIHQTTPWRTLRSDQGQTVLTGSITDVTLRRLSTARETGLVEELAVEITVDYTWKDGRTGKTLLARKGFRGVESFVPSRGVGERIEVGESGAVQAVARQVVASMRSGF